MTPLTLDELAEVLTRPKFDPYVTPEEVSMIDVRSPIKETVNADPR
jgi:hypothetical protein